MGFAQTTQASPSRRVAEFPRQPQEQANEPQNRDLSEQQQQQDHPRRLMHKDAPVVVIGRHHITKSARHDGAIQKKVERCKNPTRFALPHAASGTYLPVSRERWRSPGD
jgi:hypothetical protein